MMVMVVISCGTGCSFDYKYFKKNCFSGCSICGVGRGCSVTIAVLLVL